MSCRRGEGGQSSRRVCGDPETRGLLRRTSLWSEHGFALTAGESSFRSGACRPSRFPWRASAATGFSRDAAPWARGDAGLCGPFQAWPGIGLCEWGVHAAGQ